MSTPTRKRTTALDVDCPDCGMPAGQKCENAAGRQVRSHSERATAARADAAQPNSATITVDSAGDAEQVPDAVPDTIPDDEPPTVQLTDREIAQRLLVLKVLKGKIAEIDAELREQGVKALRVGDNISGYLDGDDRSLGRVGLSRASQTWKVVNPTALQAWVAQHAPQEIVTTESVRNSYVTALVDTCKKNGGWLNKASGEIVVPDGIELQTGSPTLSVTGSKEAEAAVTDAIAAGRLAPDGSLLALPAGSSS